MCIDYNVPYLLTIGCKIHPFYQSQTFGKLLLGFQTHKLYVFVKNIALFTIASPFRHFSSKNVMASDWMVSLYKRNFHFSISIIIRVAGCTKGGSSH